MYVIRQVDCFTDEEAVEAIHLMNRRIPGFPVLTKESLEGGWWWIAYCEGKPVGFAGLVKSARKNDDGGYLKRAMVDPKHRGHGLQLKLIRVRIAKAKKLGLPYLVTETTDTVYSANNLYRAGFKMFTPEEPWVEFAKALYWIMVL